MKRMFVSLCLMAMLTPRLSAELKYTMHMEIRKVEGAPAQAVNPMIGIMSDSVMKQMVPDGAADILYVVGDKGARIEYVQAAMGQAAGAINLARPDGTLIVMNPKSKTYWKISAQSAIASMQAAGIPAPEVTAKRTEQFETVAGVRCGVITFDWKMALPIPEAARASLPPDFPAAITMKGDSCTSTDRYQQYAEMVSKTASAMMTAMGFDKIAQGGFVLRQTMQMMGFEMRATVTQIGEEAAPESVFEIPADYKEVAAPTGGR